MFYYLRMKTTFAERLRGSREALGISQGRLATLVGHGLTQQAVAAMEDPKKKRGGSKFVPVMAVILQVEALWLASGEGPRTRNHSLTNFTQNVPARDGTEPKEVVMTIVGLIKALIEEHGQEAVARAVAKCVINAQQASRPQAEPRTS